MRLTPQNSFSKLVLLNERTSTIFGGEKFRYGYQGSEMDNEVKGEGNSYTTFFRQLDPRLGRWLTVDPKCDPTSSPYVSMDNDPILLNDPLGDYTEKRAKKLAKDGEKHGYTTQVIANRKKEGDFVVYFEKISGDTKHFETYSEGRFKGARKSAAIVDFDEPKEVPWYALGGYINFMLSTTGSIAGAKGNVNIQDMFALGIRKGTQGNYQLTGRNAKLFNTNAKMTKATAPVSKLATAGKVIGGIALVGGTIMDGIGVLNYVENPNSKNAVHPAKFVTNLSFNLMALRVNPTAGIVYSSVDCFYPGGWTGDAKNEGALMKIGGLRERNREIVPNFNYRDIGGF